MMSGRFLSVVLLAPLAWSLGCDSGGGSSSTAPSGPIVLQAGSTRLEYTSESARVVASEGSVAVSTRAVRIGSVVLFDAETATAAAPEAVEPGVVVYRRAPGLEERFIEAGQNVEQRWILDSSLQLHRGSGDLRIDVRLQTDLDAALSAPEAGPPTVLLTGPEGDVALQYGTATAIDALGNTHTLDYVLSGKDLTMVLDAAFLAGAPFPLTVDPLIGAAIPLDTNVTDRTERPLDVARGNNQWLAAWSDKSDIRVRVMTAAGAAGVSAKSAAGGADQTQAAVAWSPSNDRYLVVFHERLSGGGGTHRISGRVLDFEGTAISPLFVISDSDGSLRQRPDVACDGTDWMVVWQENVGGANDDLFARRIPVTYTAGALPNPVVPSLAAVPAGVQKDPAIAALGTGTWFLAWAEGGANAVIKGRVLSSVGAPGTERTYSATGAELPDVAGGAASGAFLVWARGGNVEAVSLASDGAPASAVAALTNAGGAAAPKAAYSATTGQVVVTWHRGNDVYAVRRWADASLVTGPEGALNGTPIAAGATEEVYPAIAWNATTDEMLVVYSAKNTGPGQTRYSVYGQRFSAYDGPTLPAALVQRRTTGGAAVPVGGWTNEAQIDLGATASDPNATDTFRMQVEIRPVASAFTSPLAVVPDGAAFFESASSASNAAEAIVLTASGLAHATAYHWQIRAVDSSGLASRWVAFPETGNAENPPTNPAAADVQVDLVAPGVALSTTAPEPTNASPIPVTVTFTEAVTGFDAGDIVPTNATVANFAGSGSVYTFDLVPGGQGAVSAAVGAAAALDVAGNPSTAAIPLGRTYDTVAPGVVLATTAPDPTNTSPIPVTVTFSEPVVGFVAADIVPSNAAVQNFAGSGASYSFHLVPTGQGLVSAGIPAAAAQDLAGNASSAAIPLSLTYDSVAPTVSMSSLSPEPTNVSPIQVAVAFSEPVIGFAVGDIVPSNATVTNFAGSGASYTFDLVPAGQGVVSAAIAAGVAVDAANNPNAAAPLFSRIYDTVPPSVAMTSAAPDPTNASPIAVTVTFSEPVSGFDATDVVPSNASVSGFSGSGASYSFDLVPAGQGAVGAAIAAGAAADPATNASTAAPPFSRTFDTLAPGVSMSSGAPDPTNTLPIVVSVLFSESVADFDAGDVATTNASVANFSGTGTSYTFHLVPAGQGVVSADILPGAAHDAAGNPSTAAPSFSRTYDTLGPGVTLSTAAPLATNTSPIPVTVTFTEPVSDFSAAGLTPTNATVANFAGSLTTYTFDLVPGGQGSVSVDVLAGAAHDAAGNPNTAAATLSRTYDTVAPGVALSTTASDPTNLASIPVTVTFSEPVGGFTASDIVPSNATVSGFAGSGASYTFNLVPSSAGIVTASIAAGTAQDPAGNANTAAAPLSLTYDGDAPGVSMASSAPEPTRVSPIHVDVTFTEPVTGFTVADVVPTNATVSNFTGSGASYGFDLVPSGQGNVGAAIGAGAAADAAGNANTAAAPFSRTYDSVAPDVSLGSTDPEPTSAAISVVVLFTEAVTGFTVGDVVPANATVSNFAGSGASYSFDLAPTAPGTFGASVPAGAALDAAGNASTASAPFSRTFDPGVILAPDALQVLSAVNPTGLLDRPDFSAVHRWSGAAPRNAVRYRIQVSTADPATLVTHWNSPAAGVLFPLSAQVAADARSPELRYGLGGQEGGGAVPRLSWNAGPYRWRIQFRDIDDNPSAFSTEAASFTMGIPSVVASANGNGTSSGVDWHFLGFPIPAGTSVPASELFEHGAVYVLRWNEATRGWVFMGSADPVEGGKGYLVMCSAAAVVDLKSGFVAVGDQGLNLSSTPLAAPAGVEVDEARPTNYYQGSQFVSNPFNREIDWVDEVDRANLLPTYFKWDGTQYLTYNAANGVGGAGRTIHPFQAIGVNVNKAVDNGAAVDIVFLDAPAGAGAGARVGKASLAGAAEAWTLNLAASSGAALDTENFLGVHPDADDAWDLRDTFEPGRFADTYVLVYVEHADWGVHAHDYTHDIRATPSDAGAEVHWSLTVKSNTGLPVTLTWPNLADLPTADWQFLVQDPASGVWLDLATTPSLDVAPAVLPATVTVPLKAVRLAAAPASEAKADAEKAPEAPAGDGGGGSSCGLLGTELLLALGLLARARRRR